MSKSITMVMERIFSGITDGYEPTVTTVSDCVLKIRYSLRFPDLREMEVDLVYRNGTVEIEVLSTDIIHLDSLKRVIDGLTEGIENNRSELKGYFRIRQARN